MKKTITKPDGSKEVLEGTPEEIAELERRIRQEPIREEPKKPELLKDEVKHLDSIDFQKLIEEAMRKKLDEQPLPFFDQRWRWQHSPFCEMKVAERGWMSVIPPRCTCGLFIYPQERFSPILDVGTQPYKLTYTFTSTCPDCGQPTTGLNSNSLCNCARGENGKVLEDSNVEARKAYREMLESVKDIKLSFQYPSNSMLGKFF